MRLGQTSALVFAAKLLAAVIAFLATILFARLLGAEVYGIYAVVIALVAWLKLFGSLGIGGAVTKRVSEGENRDAYFSAGLVWIVGFGLGLTVALLLGRGLVERYVGEFEEYVALSIVWFVVLLLGARLAFAYVRNTLEGENRVHLSGLLEPVRTGFGSLIQVGLVLFGFGLAGMLVGYALGFAIATVVGAAFVSLSVRRPTVSHFRSLFDYAKYSWLGNLKAHAYQDVDILILGAMVQSGLVGVYAIAWSLTKVLRLFGSAISQSVFPAISNLSAQQGVEATAGYVEDTVAYAGFIVIPGFVGGTILADRLLVLYGDEFVQGTEVLWLLLLGVVAYGYMRQFLTAMNALDRPELAFQTNLVFILSNVVLNVVLIWQLGWIGAAIASLVSATLGLFISVYLLRRVLVFSFPFGAVGRQVAAAGLMGAIVIGLDVLIERTGIVELNFVIVGLLVGIGAAVYVIVLYGISPGFRAVVRRNLPRYPL